MPPPAFVCCMREVEGLAGVLELVAAEFNKEHVHIRLFKARGLQIQCIDQSQSSFLDAFFDARGSKSIFSKFSCTDEVHSLWLDPGLCARALKAAGSCQMLSSKLKLRSDVHMSLAESGDRLYFEFDAVAASGVRKRSRHSISLFDPTLHGDEAEIDGATFNWSAEVFTNTPMLLHEASVTLSADDKLAIACEADFSASFAFRYFLRLAKLCKAGNNLLLQMGSDCPLRAVVDLSGGGTCQCYLAPLIDEDDGEETGAAAAPRGGGGSQRQSGGG